MLRLARWPRLRGVYLEMLCKVTLVGVTALCTCGHVRELELTGCSAVSQVPAELAPAFAVQCKLTIT